MKEKCNTGYRNTGSFCTEHGEYKLFNKKCSEEEFYCDKPDWLYFSLTKWIEENNMTDEEKKENPTFYTTGGYLKKYSYQEAARKSWDNWSNGEKEQTRNLPNFDDEVFKEIFGFSAYEEESNKINQQFKEVEKEYLRLKELIKNGG